MRVKVVDDPEYVAEVRVAIKKNDGYCPCKLRKIEDNKCMCKELREELQPGDICTCGLYIKIEN